MRVHRILPVSQANGPGRRFTVWVQGCGRGCPGCFNPDTHDRQGGYEIPVETITEQIPLGEVCGVTVSGGEPFEQAGELAVFLEAAGREKLERLVYTGFTYEQLAAHTDAAVKKSLEHSDILIDGAYDKETPPFLPWTGSGNQRVLQLKQGKIQKKCLKEDFEKTETVFGEIQIGRNGEITVTGILDSAVLEQ